MVWIERGLKRPSASNSPCRGTFQTRLLNNWPSLSICHSWSRRISTLECCLISYHSKAFGRCLWIPQFVPSLLLRLHLLAKEIQHPGVRTSQTRSHYGAGADFPCLPALERPKHHPVESFFPEWGAAFHEESLMTGTWLCHPGLQCHC